MWVEYIGMYGAPATPLGTIPLPCHTNSASRASSTYLTLGRYGLSSGLRVMIPPCRNLWGRLQNFQIFLICIDFKVTVQCDDVMHATKLSPPFYRKFGVEKIESLLPHTTQ